MRNGKLKPPKKKYGVINLQTSKRWRTAGQLHNNRYGSTRPNEIKQVVPNDATNQTRVTGGKDSSQSLTGFAGPWPTRPKLRGRTMALLCA